MMMVTDHVMSDHPMMMSDRVMSDDDDDGHDDDQLDCCRGRAPAVALDDRTPSVAHIELLLAQLRMIAERCARDAATLRARLTFVREMASKLGGSPQCYLVEVLRCGNKQLVPNFFSKM